MNDPSLIDVDGPEWRAQETTHHEGCECIVTDMHGRAHIEVRPPRGRQDDRGCFEGTVTGPHRVARARLIALAIADALSWDRRQECGRHNNDETLRRISGGCI